MPTKVEKFPKQFHIEPIEFDAESEPVTRAAGADGAAAEEPEDDGGIDIIISTETPAEEYLGNVVLSHDRSAVDMSIARKGLTLYLDHGGYPYRPLPDPALQLGIVDKVKLRDDRKLGGRAYFEQTPLAQQVRAGLKAKPPTRRFVSVRYLPIKRRIETSTEPNVPTRVVMTRWRPEEVSFVGIPADPNAGVVRAAGGGSLEEFAVETEFEATPATQEEPTMPEETLTPAAPASPAAPAPVAPEHSVTRSAGSAKPEDILSLCEAHKVPIARARDFIAQGYSLERAKATIFDESTTRGVTAQPPAELRADLSALSDKERKQYSVARALSMAVAVREGTGRFEGLEARVSEEIKRQTPSSYRGVGGFFVPMDLLTREQREELEARRGTRAMGTGVSGGGAELVFDRMGNLIDLLRNRMLTAQFGANVLTGLTGPVQFPVQTGDPTAYFISENPGSGAPSSQLAFTTRTLSPKEAVAVVPFPRRLLNMASVDIESRVRTSLIAKHALLRDRMGLHGRGTDGEPTGIFNTPGVATVDFGNTVPTYGKLVDMGGAIADANADTATMRYMTTPTMAAKLKQTLVASAAGSAFIWEGTFRDGQMAGYGAGSTKQVRNDMGAGADHGIAFGDWSFLTYGSWGALEFIVDVVTLADKGQIKITTNEMFDNVVERPEAFCISTGARLS